MTAARSYSNPLETGLAHHRAGRLAKAEKAYKRVLAKDAKDAHALHLLGLAAADRGRGERALQLIEKALALEPENANFLHSAGHVLATVGRFEAAAERYEAALAVDPDRALTLSNLGNVLRRLDRIDAATRSLQRAVELDPGFAEGWSNLGLALRKAGKEADAKAAFARAVALRPNGANFRYNLANAALAADDFESAAAAFRKVLELEPAHAGACMNLATALKRQGDLAAATDVLQDTLAALPKNHPATAEVHWNLGLNLLTAGDYRRGWREFEWRRRMPGYGAEAPRLPAWRGEPMGGRRLLVNHEQGFGDAFQFMGFAGDLAARGAEVIYRGPRAMLPIIGCMTGVSGTVAFEDPLPEAHAWVPMMSLPYLLDLTEPADLLRGETLVPSGPGAAAYTERLAAIAGLRIGICWQGNPDYRADRDRSIPLKSFIWLARLPGVTLIALQKGAGRDQLTGWPGGLPLIDLGAEIDAAGGAFMETAQLIRSLDLVVSSDTALVHLAGALGIEAHVALASMPDWRWGLEGGRSVWYPTLTLHRQRRPGDWDEVFRRIAQTIERRARTHA